MNWIVVALVAVLGLVYLVCALSIIVQIFKREGAFKGIFSLFCGAYAFFYGWSNASGWDMTRRAAGAPAVWKRVMLTWTLSAIGIAVLTRFLGP